MTADRHSSLFSDNLQDVLDASANGVRKGTSHWSTPPELGARLAEGLGPHRPVITDLTCGQGHLLRATMNGTTKHLLGLDITACRRPSLPDSVQWSFIHSDLGRAYPLLLDTGWTGELFVLNPPWDLHWPKAAFLRPDAAQDDGAREHNSRLAGVDPRIGQSHIDSAIATWLVALDRCASGGEGFILMNAATLQRLVLDEDAPFACLAQHIWAIAEFPHWIPQRDGRAPLRVACAWWKASAGWGSEGNERHFRYSSIDRIRTPDRYSCLMGTPRRLMDSSPKWRAVAHESERLISNTHDWNIWLDREGAIRCHLSVYDRASQRVPKEAAEALHHLNGRRPADLVLRRHERDALQDAVCGTLWRVAPAVSAAVNAAIAEYHRDRAPIISLPRTQRLGFLDEFDSIRCTANLNVSLPDGSSHTAYCAGRSYRLGSSTTKVVRRSTRTNSAGEAEPVELVGSELVIRIRDDAGHNRPFLDPRVLHPSVTLPEVEDRPDAMSLEVLLGHFEIPDVPDIATTQPEEAQAAAARLHELERALAAR